MGSPSSSFRSGGKSSSRPVFSPYNIEDTMKKKSFVDEDLSIDEDLSFERKDKSQVAIVLELFEELEECRTNAKRIFKQYNNAEKKIKDKKQEIYEAINKLEPNIRKSLTTLFAEADKVDSLENDEITEDFDER